MKVSVIIPAWGDTPYLGKALASIEAQTCRDFEVVRCEPPAGKRTAGSARLAGAKRARGEWVMFVDADDRLLPEAVERLVACADEKTDVVVSGLTRNGVKRSWGEDVWETGPGDVFNAQVAKLFRRSLFDGIVCDDAVAFGEDLMVTAQLLHKARKIAIVRDSFYYYRDNPSSMTHCLDGRKRVKDLMRVGEILRQAMPEPAFSDFHDRITRDAMLLWCRYRLLDRRMWQELRARLKGGLLSDPRHGLPKKGALFLAHCLFD